MQAKKKLYISSVMYNNKLKDDRNFVEKYLNNNFQNEIIVNMFKEMPTKPILNHDIYDNVARNDFFVILVGDEITPVVQSEFDAAEILGLPIYIFLKSGQKDKWVKRIIKEKFKNYHIFDYKNSIELERSLIFAKEIVSDNLKYYDNNNADGLMKIYDEIIAVLNRDPDLIDNISPRKFEEVIANILKAMGHDVELTPMTRDGGVDIKVKIKNNQDFNFQKENRYYVEVKLWNPKNKIGSPVLQKLFGASKPFNADGMIIVTSSYFTKEALAYMNSNKELKEYIRLYNRDQLPEFYKNYLNLKEIRKKGDKNDSVQP